MSKYVTTKWLKSVSTGKVYCAVVMHNGPHYEILRFGGNEQQLLYTPDDSDRANLCAQHCAFELGVEYRDSSETSHQEPEPVIQS